MKTNSHLTKHAHLLYHLTMVDKPFFNLLTGTSKKRHSSTGVKLLLILTYVFTSLAGLFFMFPATPAVSASMGASTIALRGNGTSLIDQQQKTEFTYFSFQWLLPTNSYNCSFGFSTNEHVESLFIPFNPSFTTGIRAPPVSFS